MNKRTVLCLALMAMIACKKAKPNNEPMPGSATGSGSGSGSAAATGSAVAPDTTKPEPTKPDPALVARGEYVATVTACAMCHTPMGPTGPDFKKMWAGGLEIPEKFGTWRSPNITQDKGTGIGSWTDDQILAAIREGVRPDGGKLFPIMPYLNYNRMTDADGKALVAYLRTIPALENVVAPNKDLKMPKIPAPKPENAPDVSDDPIKHGEYLVSLMHCNICHTPMGPDGAPDMKRMFAGGFEFELPMMGEGKLYGANLTSDPETGLGKWTEEQIAQTLKTMTRPNGKVIQGPMLFYQGLWSRLEDKDIKAIAAYVKSIPAVKNKVPASTFTPKPMGPPPGAGSGSGSGAAPAAAGSGSATK